MLHCLHIPELTLLPYLSAVCNLSFTAQSAIDFDHTISQRIPFPKLTSHSPLSLPACKYVSPKSDEFHYEAAMVEAVDGAIRQLVYRCGRVQETWPEVDDLNATERLSIIAEGSELTPTNHRADDLIPEESDTVLLALKRLPPKEAYDRVFRLRRAFQVRLPMQESDTNLSPRGFANTRSVLSCPPIAPGGPADYARRCMSLNLCGSGTVILQAIQDYPYLTPIIKEIESESRERGDLESMVIQKRQANKPAEDTHGSY